MTDLLQQLLLADSRLRKLSAELLRQPDPQRELKTKINFTPTPLQATAVDNDSRPLWLVNAQLTCDGAHPSEAGPEPVFAISCLMQLSYRQMVGPALDFEAIKAHHMGLSRQIYPLLIRQVQPLLSQLGVHQVRLPPDMLQVKAATAERPDQLH